tara:strand:+ start:204 stop:410 length:207 start_codon:yes stop_codon:yes gene_type:complete
MKNIFQRKGMLLLILISLGFFIFMVDNKLSNGFLETNNTSNHFLFIGSLVFAVSILLAIILKIDDNSK